MTTETTYEYIGPDNKLAYQTIRLYNPKRFFQRRPDGNGGWITNLEDVERIPYRLDDITAAIDAGRPVWIVEGEKDADLLAAADLAATTSAGGTAWNWPDSWAEYFRGAPTVYVLADNDATGRKAALQRARIVARAVADVRLVEHIPDVAEKGDVSDWLGAGHSIGDLWALAEGAPGIRYHEDDREGTTTTHEPGWIDLGPIVAGDEPPIEPGIIHRDDGTGLLYPGALHEIHAEPSHGKTWFALTCCAHVLATGAAFGYLDFEGTALTFVSRLRALGVHDELIADPARVAYYNPIGKLDQTTIERLNDDLAAMKAAFVAIDAFLPALIRNGGDENSNRDVADWYETVARPLTRHGDTTVIVLDHVTKDTATRMRGARGASAKLQLVDVSYELTMPDPFSRTKAGKFALKCAKDRHGVFPIGARVAEVDVEPFANGHHIEMTVHGPGAPTVLMTRIATYLAGLDKPVSQRVIEREVEGNAGKLRWALKDYLVDQGYVGYGSDGYRLIRPYPAPPA